MSTSILATTVRDPPRQRETREHLRRSRLRRLSPIQIEFCPERPPFAFARPPKQTQTLGRARDNEKRTQGTWPSVLQTSLQDSASNLFFI